MRPASVQSQVITVEGPLLHTCHHSADRHHQVEPAGHQAPGRRIRPPAPDGMAVRAGRCSVGSFAVGSPVER